MTNIKTLSMTVGLSIFMITSCNNSESNKTLNTSEYFPLSIGNKWEYSVEYTTELLNVKKGEMIAKIDGKEKINDKDYFKLLYVYSGIPGVETETYYIRKSDEGYFAINGKYKGSSEYLDMKLPIEVGSNWKSIMPELEIDYNIVGIETLELIDRKYKNCIKITFERNDGGEGIIYLAKGIGMVKYILKVNHIAFDMTLDNHN